MYQDLVFKAVLTNRVVGYRWLRQTQLVVRNLGRASNAHQKSFATRLLLCIIGGSKS